MSTAHATSPAAALIAAMQARGVLTTPRIIAAFRAVDRAHFVPAALRAHAYDDTPLPIGDGQTISQPSTVAFMLEQLAVPPRAHVLDVGSGSGYTTALLAHLVGPRGRVLGVELRPTLVHFGQANLRRAGIPPSIATIRQAVPDVLGAPEEAPFDRILVSAAAPTIPQDLVAQLRDGGIMVVPVRDRIVRVQRRGATVTTTATPGFAFVPLITSPRAPVVD